MFYPKYDPGTYITRDLYRKVTETNDLRVVWAHSNAQKWGVEYEPYLALCETHCSCCGSPLNYGLGKNNVDKADINTPSTDHKIPRSKGGTNDIKNLWVICNKCNILKNNATHEDIQRYENIIRVLKETVDTKPK
jgi:5-methylcytosine-specific restriction endonuclease McrA